ncbi:hypothetical protein [Komagataeibacter diospyri]|uniref:hypothetical protein n=1 Tax=Komagataeibacter diospyri TaxID=1932662 RepID=UPI003757BC3F
MAPDFLKLGISVDAADVQKKLAKLSETGIRSATANAMNKLANGARWQIVDRMKEVFDSPGRFTLGGFTVKKATPSDLSAWVGTIDFAARGTPAIRYLGPQIWGGPRDMKRSEKLLSDISGGQFWVPGPGAPLDASGNIQRSEIVRILSRLGVMQQSQKNMSDRTARRLQRQNKNARGQRSEYFVGHAKGRGGNGRPTGIFKLVGPGKVVPILWFVPTRPTYRVRLPVNEIVENTVSARMERTVTNAINAEVKREMS